MKSCEGRFLHGATPISCAMAQYCHAMSRWLTCSRKTSQDGDSVGRRILVADDEKVVTDLLQRSLRYFKGCRISAVNDGDAVIRHLAEEPVDVLLTDMVMPGLHGLDLIRTVSQQWPSTDIIVMTGYPEDFPYVDVIRHGARDFITKPHRHAELEAKLRRLFWERGLREAQLFAEAKYRSIFELNMDGMLLVDYETLSIVDMNSAFCEHYGQTPDALTGRPLLDLLAPNDRERLLRGLQLCAPRAKGTLSDILFLNPEGHPIYFDVSLTFLSFAPKQTVCLSLKDVSEKRHMEEELLEFAQTDELTGLGNKRSFDTKLSIMIAHAEAEELPVSLLYMDLDNFKSCNDTHGHQMGDRLLSHVGRIIHDNIRHGTDEGFRFGGDEFAALLIGASADTGPHVGERIRCALHQSENFATTMSVGVARHVPGTPPEVLIRRADTALYQAKASGKNAVCEAPDC